MLELWGAVGKRQENELLDFAPARADLAVMSVAASIEAKLAAAFAPSLLEVIDDSGRHAGHAGATRPDGTHGETHFQVRLVSVHFAGMSRVERQRRVYAVLADELAGPVHALTLKALTPGEAAP
jgi:BolA protein